jgi:hypothetical protein
MKDRNFVMQDRVNEHLLFCKPSSPEHPEGYMNPPNERSPLPSFEVPPGMLPVIPAAAERSATTIAGDRLYQLAALTAGAFLLATLL